MAKLELYYPTKPWRINQGFGNVMKVYTDMGLQGHNGIDAYAPDSWIVRAAHDGVVVFTGYDGGGGLGGVIRTTEPFDYNGKQTYFKTIYWHLKKDCVVVKPDQRVTVGQIIGLADNTGLSTGSHLHFGLKPVYKGENDWDLQNVDQNNGYKGAIDPTPYFVGICAEDASTWTKVTAVVQNLALRVKILAELVKVASK